MAPYATAATLKDLIGTERLTAALAKNVDTGDVNTLLTTKAESASGLMDSYFKRGGYTAPIDLSLISDADAQARLTALLADVCAAMVHQALTPGQRGFGKGQEESRDWARRWLEDIASGRVALPGVTKSSRRLAVVGTDAPQVPDSLFTGIRYPG